IFPHMPAPPLARILDVGKNHVFRKRNQHALFHEWFQSPGTSMENIEVTDTGLELRSCLTGILRSRRGDQFHFNAKFLLERLFVLFSQYGGGRTAGRELLVFFV